MANKNKKKNNKKLIIYYETLANINHNNYFLEWET